jgi:4-hydroxy-2,2'-bipyrrole-5-carbaldehyde O-methyltransferase
MRSFEAQARGLLGTLRTGHLSARALAVADSRVMVRALFLASAVRLGILGELGAGRSFPDLVTATGCTRPERLRAWLSVGVELHELAVHDDRYVVRGRRARALADGDALLGAHYRSMLDYQGGAYEELASLLHADPGTGRTDLDEHADVIAEVSLAAAPFVTPYLERVVAELQPQRALDVGCGTGVYVRALLDADPVLVVDGIDLSAGVIDDARQRLQAAGVGARAHLAAADVRSWEPEARRRFDLITLLNDVYYFAEPERAALYERLGGFLTDDGELVVVTMTRQGSIASAHLHFMLACEAGDASLPESGAVPADLLRAGYRVVDEHALVPTEPFVAVRASRAAG